MRSRRFALLLAVASVVSLITAGAVAAGGAGGGSDRAVFAQSNDATGNAVLMFARQADGTLSAPTSFSTGGLGTGAGLGSQGSVVLSRNERWLLAVNAGSDDVSLFAVGEHGLQLRDRDATHGDMPISVAIHHRLVYVLNAGGDGTISGFRLTDSGTLRAIRQSSRPLSAPGAGPAQVSFTPDGDRLVVTEKNTNVISTYRIGSNGRAHGPTVSPSAGATPFGFDFARSGHLVVSEAFGGAPDASAVSSYRIRQGGLLTTISPSVGTTQTAACWVVTTRRFAYVTNTGSGTVSSYRTRGDGTLELLEAAAGDTGMGSAPIDAAVSGNARFLFVLGDGTDEITTFRIRRDGSLEWVSAISGLPGSTVGLAAR
ncbi:MAG TPA: beta-propeller fold lactonase family protein [Candidatus Limnocylindria bacterium]|jgi:6-phosphogluconolactonase (cycloisomerase 2 family)